MLNHKLMQLFIATVFLMSIGCVKKRDEKFVQGQGEDLLKVQELDGQEVTITTGNTFLDVQGEKIENCERSVVTSTDIEEMNSLKWIVAKPNKTYKARVGLVENKMVVYKITDQKDLMECEKPTATKEGNNYLVPVAQFQVEYVKVEKEKDFNDDPTSRLYEKRVKKEEADFVRITPYSGRSFGEDLYPQDYIAIKDIDKLLSQRVKIKTISVLKRLRPFRIKEGTKALINSKKYQFYNNLDEVSYEAIGDTYNLLEGAQVYGEVGETFDVKFILEGDHIVAYKVGDRSNLTRLELDISKEKNGKILVPIRAYSVQYFKLSQDLDSMGIPKPELGKHALLNSRGASHIIIRKETGKNFTAQLSERQNLWPLKYLMDGEWYYDKTLVDKSNTRENWGAALGMSEDSSWDFGTVTKIQFRLVEESSGFELQLVNTADANETRLEFRKAEGTYGDVLTKSFFTKLAPIEFKEEVLQREFERLDKEKTYVKIPFRGQIVDSLRIEDDYMSYTIRESGSSVEKYRVAFKRVTPNPNVKPRVYYKEHRKKFGLFSKVKPDKRENQKREGDRIRFVNRFYPVNNVIQYYFSKESTKDPYLRSLAVRAIKDWDEAFIAAGTKIRVQINDSVGEDKPLGDIRYNVINLVDSAEGRLRGYGPSKQDPHTGAIVSASANVYTNTFLESHENFLRAFLRFRSGKLDDKYLYFKGGEAPLVSFSKASVREQSQNSPFVKSNYRSIEKLFDTEQCHPFLEYAEKMAIKYEPLKTEEEKKFFKPCSLHALEDEFVLVLSHELGHNFGLRHNFRASTDWKNYPEYSPTDHPYDIVKGASVMDYYPTGFKNPTKPGKYDIAALKYAYGEEVPEKEANLEQIYGEFKFCTDQDVYDGGNNINYLVDCLRHDYGSTMLEATTNRILDLKSLMVERLHRYDDRRWMGDHYYFKKNAWVNLFVSMSQDLHRIYATWRKHLADYIKTNSDLDRLYNPLQMVAVDPEEFNELVENRFFKDSRYSYLKDYRAASDEVYSFYKDFLVATPRYCVVDESGVRKLLHLETLRTTIFLTKGESIIYCDDEKTMKYLEGQGQTLVGATGLFINKVLDTQDPIKKAEALTSVVAMGDLRKNVRKIVAEGQIQAHDYKMQDDPILSQQTKLILEKQILKQEKVEEILKPLALPAPENKYDIDLYSRFIDEEKEYFDSLRTDFMRQISDYGDASAKPRKYDEIRFIGDLSGEDSRNFIIQQTLAYYEAETDVARQQIIEASEIRNINPKDYAKPVPFKSIHWVTAHKGTIAEKILKKYSVFEKMEREGKTLNADERREFDFLYSTILSWIDLRVI